MTFSKKTREQTIKKLKEEKQDLLIIGGGITGAGVAIQAAASGIKTGLIEMQDFAEGTSSRSTKLVHGGIRYLKNFDVGVVADTVSERAVVQGIAPHIPRPTPMLMPIYDEPEATYDMFSVKIAMDLYDKLAGVTGTQYANYTIDKDEVLQREPGLKRDKLKGAGVYLDFVNNDSRLVIENIKEADELGANVASHVKAVGMTYDENGHVDGLKAHDELTGEDFTIKSKLVINTAGPWVDKVKALNEKEKNKKTLRPTKGIHLVVDSSRLNVPQPTYFDSGLHDGRMIFVVPREGKTYFGTTDTDYNGDYLHPRVEQSDVDYLLKAINNRYPNSKIKIDDVEASWAGLRPLISSNGSSDYNGGGANTGKVSDESFNNLINVVNKFEANNAERSDVEKAISKLKTAHAEETVKPSQVSRGSDLTVDKTGLITLSGGKITDYRKMAEGALKLIRNILKNNFNKDIKEIDSKKLQVSGGHFDPNNVDDSLKFYAQLATNIGISQEDAVDLANRFGSNTGRVITYASDGPAEGLNLKETISLKYSVNEEMTLTLVDYLLRRTNFILFHRDKLSEIKKPIIDEMSKLLNWDKSEKEYQTKKLEETLEESELRYLK